MVNPSHFGQCVVCGNVIESYSTYCQPCANFHVSRRKRGGKPPKRCLICNKIIDRYSTYCSKHYLFIYRMTAVNQQIVEQFETLGMSPEEIAEQEGLDVISVKSALLQNSVVYRKALKNDVDGNLSFTDEEEVMARQVIANIARYADEPGIQLRAAMFIRNDKKGRLDQQGLGTLNVNILQFNEQLKKAIEAKKRSVKAIDVESVAV